MFVVMRCQDVILGPENNKNKKNLWKQKVTILKYAKWKVLTEEISMIPEDQELTKVLMLTLWPQSRILTIYNNLMDNANLDALFIFSSPAEYKKKL